MLCLLVASFSLAALLDVWLLSIAFFACLLGARCFPLAVFLASRLLFAFRSHVLLDLCLRFAGVSRVFWLAVCLRVHHFCLSFACCLLALCFLFACFRLLFGLPAGVPEELPEELLKGSRRVPERLPESSRRALGSDACAACALPASWGSLGERLWGDLESLSKLLEWSCWGLLFECCGGTAWEIILAPILPTSHPHKRPRNGPGKAPQTSFDTRGRTC